MKEWLKSMMIVLEMKMKKKGKLLYILCTVRKIKKIDGVGYRVCSFVCSRQIKI